MRADQNVAMMKVRQRHAALMEGREDLAYPIEQFGRHRSGSPVGQRAAVDPLQRQGKPAGAAEASGDPRDSFRRSVGRHLATDEQPAHGMSYPGRTAAVVLEHDAPVFVGVDQYVCLGPIPAAETRDRITAAQPQVTSLLL